MRIPHLRAFLPEARRIVRARGSRRAGIDSVAGWGMKPTAARARAFAQRRRLPYLALEDGFIRSLGPPADGYAPLSLVVDEIGIYYDATRPSTLELMLEQASHAELPLDEALAAMARIRTERLTKINAAPDVEERDLGVSDRPLIVVFDQTFGDMSVELGLASERSFLDMLDAALDEHPDGRIVVKLHPEVVAGRRRGYLAERARRLKVPVLARDVNPLSLVERAAQVYTVTSQAGMEALLCGTPVTCFGMPFYAGWGATEDRLSCPRRTRRRSVLEIFAAAYLRYARYVDPITGQPCAIAQALDRLAVMKRAGERNRGYAACVGFSRWKQRMVGPFFAGPAASHAFVPDVASALDQARRVSGRICVWASREPDRLDAWARAARVPLVRVEDGFLRSVGLGSDFVPGASLVFDRQGIYYDPSRPSDLEHILEFEDFGPDLLEQAGRLRTRLIETGVTKYNLGDKAVPALAASHGRRRILVPGQVEDDASVRAGGGPIQTNLQLLRAVRAACPDACIVYKPHPEVDAGNRQGVVSDVEAARLGAQVLRDVGAHAIIAAVDEVHTLTSLMGFEALLLGRKVVTYGAPFYAGWGLTEDRVALPARTRRRSLDELVAGALLVYPAYIDPVTRLPCDALTVVERLAEARRRGAGSGITGRRLWRQARRGLRATILSAALPGRA